MKGKRGYTLYAHNHIVDFFPKHRTIFKKLNLTFFSFNFIGVVKISSFHIYKNYTSYGLRKKDILKFRQIYTLYFYL